ncbi:MAG: ATP-binding protein, partial [Planctomycetes bacterium]|nr:ATP-binding protein [Planctomycetota bacterium]
DNGEIKIKLDECGSEQTNSNQQNLLFQVIDQGEGISKENTDKIFNKYETIKMNKNHVLQTGFGLAFCKMVVNAHNGKIYVKRNKPKGSIFNVEI